MHKLLSQQVERYIEQHSSPQHPILSDLERDTHLNVLHPQMLSGQVQGAFLKLFAQLQQPQRVLEIGTFTGYSAICLAMGMPSDGELITIDVNEELKPYIQKHVDQAGLSSIIDFRVGDAREIIPTLEGEFDLVFIDANKDHYSDYYEVSFDKVKKGGFIIADNVLWYGKVAHPEETDRATEALRAFNKMVQEDKRVENVLLSVRDGLMVVRKL